MLHKADPLSLLNVLLVVKCELLKNCVGAIVKQESLVVLSIFMIRYSRQQRWPDLPHRSL